MTTPPRKRAAAKGSTGKGLTGKGSSSKGSAGKAASAKGPAAEQETASAKAAAQKQEQEKQQEKQDQAAQAQIESPAAAAADAPVPPPPPVRTASAARALAWMTLGLGLVVGIGAITWPWWSVKVAEVAPFLAPNGEADPALDKLAGRIQALEQQARSLETDKSGTLAQLEQERARFQDELKVLMSRLERVEKAVSEARDLVKAADAPSSTALAAESLKALSERLAELEQGDEKVGRLAARLEQFEKNQDGGALTAAPGPDPKTQSALDAMAERLKRLEQETDGLSASAGDDAAARAIVLAVAQLRDAVREGRPFEADLEGLIALADGRPAISQALADLTPQAANGVSTLAALRTRFATLAGPIVSAADSAEGDGWIAEAAAKLASLVTVRRVGDAAPAGSIDALVHRVDALLAAGDLSSAAEALKLLKGKPGEIVAPWLRAADARLAAEKAVANLHVHALSLLTPAKAGG
jgi:uroporphyrinogen-III synthase